MILLWGLSGDDPLDAVGAALDRRGADVYLVDQRLVLEQRLELDIGRRIGGTLWCGTRQLSLDDVRAMYTRVYDIQKLRRVADASTDVRARALEVECTLWAFSDETSARVVNRPSAMASNGSKPYQSTLIARVGFLVPETLVTTDPEAAAEFWNRHGHVVYKSVSNVRSIVSRLCECDRERLARVAWCPTQFQAYVPGRDHRVHVVGDEIFAVEVASDADDYRYAHRQGMNCALRTTKLPPDVAARAFKVARSLDLPLCGIDLRRTPDGAWYCFEVNPSPCFTYYEHHTGQPIADAVATLLDQQ